MTVVQSLGRLADLAPRWAPSASYSSGSLQLYDRYYYDYATLYRTQPNVRTCVDFLARNIAQLGLHVFRRVSETDRERLRDHGLVRTLERPLPPEYKVTRYRLIEELMGDLGVYFNAFWVKLRAGDRLGLLRVPPPYVTVYGGLVPTGYEVSLGGRKLQLRADQVVHFRGYNAGSSVVGLSPLETLRRVLAEEQAMGDYREHFWQNAARIDGVIERPLEAPEWSETARERFRAEFGALYSGGDNSGKTAILEEGMTWKEAAFNAQESEYLGGRKLTREECARAYHIPLPMVGILDHATFSNIKEQHKNLYQDALGPWLAMIEQDIELQLLPEFPDSEGVYCEFNIAEKLQGSFEEQVAALQSAVGAPYMSRNEARARMNLPSVEGGDEIVTPLNVLVGGQASPRDSAPKALPAPLHKADGELDPTQPRLRAQHVEKWREVIAAYFRRQGSAIASRVPKARIVSIEDVWRDGERWDRELQADLLALNLATATVWARWVAEQVGAEVSEDAMLAYLAEHSRIQAEQINATTREQVGEALREAEALAAVRGVFELAANSRAAQIGQTAVTTASNFGSQEGARAGGLRTKTWQVNSSNPRPSHAAMHGVSVAIGQAFPNGMKWPGDPTGGAAEVANCTCSVRFGR
jgi:HK97 family phage portal protein